MAGASILLVDDDPNILRTLGMRLEALGYRVATATDGQNAIDTAIARPPDLMLLDLRLPKKDGLQVLVEVKERLPDVEVILLTAQGSVETAVAAIKAGAYDYVEKPVDSQRLRILLEKALARRSDRRELGRLKDRLREMGRYGHLVGQSGPMQDLYRLIDQVAAADATVLITGPSGTGKELVARTLHDMSPRAGGPFIAVNCSAIMASLWEAETFGYEKGAFTDAHKRHTGFIEQAQGGTLFLDEVGELSPASQAKFLRVLESHCITRIGGTTEIAVDMRVVAATNRNLEAAVAEGRFRDDLYYRLNVVNLQVPPLRERPSDIPLLVDGFLREFAHRAGKEGLEMTDACMAHLRRHHWPGNVRELRNAVERAVILVTGNRVTEQNLPPAILGADRRRVSASADNARVVHGASPGLPQGRPGGLPNGLSGGLPNNLPTGLANGLPNGLTEGAGGDGPMPPDGSATAFAGDLSEMTIQAMERQMIYAALDRTGGNKTRAALGLGISLKTLHNKLGRYRREDGGAEVAPASETP